MRRLACLIVFLGAMGTGRAARADATTADAVAREEYDRGAAAYEIKDFPRAATLFAHADELVPNPMVLKLALASVVQTDDAVLGMALVLRADARAVDGSLAVLAREVRARFETKVGIVRVVCRARGACRARIGDRTVSDGELVASLPGDVDVTFDPSGHEAHTAVRVTARAVVRAVEPEAPKPAPVAPVLAPPPVLPRAPERGWSQGVFFSGVGLTAVLGGLTVASGLDTAHQHTVFLRNPTPDGKDNGQAGELRTNIGLVATCVSFAATAIVGLVLTDWAGSPGTVTF